MITVACCLWKEFPLQGWAETYVQRLRDSVRRHLRRTHHFVCFADRDLSIDVDVRRLNPPSWEGNLPKTFVYSPEARLYGRVMLFDLDNVIVGSLEDMAAYDGPLCVRGRLSAVRLPDGDMISFDADRVGHLWEKACARDVSARSRNGREREFILWAAPHADVWQEVCPGQVVSYRHHCRNRGLPPNARVVSCHGKPRPHEITESFIVEHWR